MDKCYLLDPKKLTFENLGLDPRRVVLAPHGDQMLTSEKAHPFYHPDGFTKKEVNDINWGCLLLNCFIEKYEMCCILFPMKGGAAVIEKKIPCGTDQKTIEDMTVADVYSVYSYDSVYTETKELARKGKATDTEGKVLLEGLLEYVSKKFSYELLMVETSPDTWKFLEPEEGLEETGRWVEVFSPYRMKDNEMKIGKFHHEKDLFEVPFTYNLCRFNLTMQKEENGSWCLALNVPASPYTVDIEHFNFGDSLEKAFEQFIQIADRMLGELYNLNPATSRLGEKIVELLDEADDQELINRILGPEYEDD